jgi:hypothetical protein
MRALNRHVERVFNPDRKDPHWGDESGHEIDEAGRRSCPLLIALRTSRTSRHVRKSANKRHSK